MSTEPLRIYLLDDQTMLRAGFRSLIESDGRFVVVGEHGEPRAALDEIAKLHPDVLLLDISMPGLSGLDAIPHVRERAPKTRIVMLTHQIGQSFVRQAMEAGADGFLAKDSEPEELFLAITSAHKGRSFVTPRVQGPAAHSGTGEPLPGRSSTGLPSLTPREREVFLLLALGKSNKEVAAELGMTTGTSKKHRENLQR
ncbi:MAG: response regulator transcription factor, partial [Planctomycetes bacterium]|nr:response regulator transcription factor [Planctomycetota bacterium]